MRAILALLIGLAAVAVISGFVYKKKSVPTMLTKHRDVFSDLLSKEYIREYKHYRATGNQTRRYKQLVKTMQMPLNLRMKDFNEMPQPKVDVLCLVCRSLVSLFMGLLSDGASPEEVGQVAFDQCSMLGLQPPNICFGLIEMNLHVLTFIFSARPELTANDVCALFLQSSECGELGDFYEFSIDIDRTDEKPITQSRPAAPLSSLPPYKIIHVTDIHYDPHYVEGANAVCGEPACCRSDQGMAVDPANGAGFWGDYRDCDTPESGVVDVFQRMQEAHPDADFVYHTGDIVDHGVWETSQTLVEDSFNKIHDYFQTHFDIPVFSIMGNHEAHPVNVFAPNNIVSTKLTTQWLYDLAADRWSYWLPASTIQTIRSGGYYTVLVRHGFRVIVLNNNDCYTYNFWILHNPQHLSVQLQWLHNTLLAAERVGEKVHILAHVPSGQSSCFRVWAREYRRILDRFWDTVVAQFNGHTHEDEFNVLYARDHPEFAVGQAWNGGSATAFSDVNLNYVVYTVDRESFEVLDVDSYYYNLTEANMHPERRPIWQKLYSFKQQFGLEDVSPASLDGLVHRLAANRELLHEHWVNTVKAGDTSLARGCNNDCLLNTLCDIVVNEMGDNRKCEELAAIFRANLNKNSISG